MPGKSRPATRPPRATPRVPTRCTYPRRAGTRADVSPRDATAGTTSRGSSAKNVWRLGGAGRLVAPPRRRRPRGTRRRRSRRPPSPSASDRRRRSCRPRRRESTRREAAYPAARTSRRRNARRSSTVPPGWTERTAPTPRAPPPRGYPNENPRRRACESASPTCRSNTRPVANRPRARAAYPPRTPTAPAPSSPRRRPARTAAINF